MSPATFRLIILVSCAHGLVHVFELSLPSVEQMIGDEFSVGRERTGELGMYWRLPFGLGAVLAGWLADRWGSRKMLIVYLIGCAATSVAAFYAPTLSVLFAVMFAMGCFASIYHPAGLSLISRETTAEDRGVALGWHGIFGSIGIASAPFIAALVFTSGQVTWRQYYLILMAPAIVIAILLGGSIRRSSNGDKPSTDTDPTKTSSHDTTKMLWTNYSLIVITGALSGIVYGAFMHFLPRYLDSAGLRPDSITPESFRNYLAALVLLCGVGGQAWAGKLAKPERLDTLLPLILFLNAPFLALMAIAEGPLRLVATCLLALVHFMNQPVYNSLVAQCVPRERRSLGYGFSNMMCFGVGAIGPWYAGHAQTDFRVYGGLAIVSLAAAFVGLTLRIRNRRLSRSGA